MSALLASVMLAVLLPPGAAWAQSVSADGQDQTLTKAAAAAQGKTVRVTKSDGTRISGKLESLGSTNVVVQRNGSNVNVPLAEVRRVEKVGRGMWKGLIIGGIAGFVYGYGVAEADAGEAKWATIIGAMGAAGGAGLGAMIDVARRGRNTIYTAKSGSSTTVALSVLGPRRASLTLKLTW